MQSGASAKDAGLADASALRGGASLGSDEKMRSVGDKVEGAGGASVGKALSVAVDGGGGVVGRLAPTAKAASGARDAEAMAIAEADSGGPRRNASPLEAGAAGTAGGGTGNLGAAGSAEAGGAGGGHPVPMSEGGSAGEPTEHGGPGGSSAEGGHGGVAGAESMGGVLSGGAGPLQPELPLLGTSCAFPQTIVSFDFHGEDMPSPQVPPMSYQLCPGEHSDQCELTAEGRLNTYGERACMEIFPSEEFTIRCYPDDAVPVEEGCISHAWTGPFDDLSDSNRRTCCFAEEFSNTDDYVYRACNDTVEGKRCNPPGDRCLNEGVCVDGECTSREPTRCDDGLFCTGQEYCDSELGCMIGTSRREPRDPCATILCDEETGTVSYLDYANCEHVCDDPREVYYRLELWPSNGNQFEWSHSQLGCGESHGHCAIANGGELYVTEGNGTLRSPIVTEGCVTFIEEPWNPPNATMGTRKITRTCCLGPPPEETP